MFQSVITVPDFVVQILPLLLFQSILFATSALLLLLSFFSVIVVFDIVRIFFFVVVDVACT